LFDFRTIVATNPDIAAAITENAETDNMNSSIINPYTPKVMLSNIIIRFMVINNMNILNLPPSLYDTSKGSRYSIRCRNYAVLFRRKILSNTIPRILKACYLHYPEITSYYLSSKILYNRIRKVLLDN